MGRVYLIRHGQAGTRQNYDTLSAQGARQAGLLREWLVRESIVFEEVISGSLVRQIETARIAAGEPAIDPSFTEFDLDLVYRSLAPRLCEIDRQFLADYEAMQSVMAREDAPVHREWNRCDMMVFRAWFEGRLPCDGETWAEFKARVRGGLARIQSPAGRRAIGIFTSATPIGLLLAAILDTSDEHAMRLAGACYNASVTTLRVHEGHASLLGFNAVAHLDDPTLRTFR
jgi:broad specificity phosphatase PhoE